MREEFFLCEKFFYSEFVRGRIVVKGVLDIEDERLHFEERWTLRAAHRTEFLTQFSLSMNHQIQRNNELAPHILSEKNQSKQQRRYLLWKVF